MAVPGRGWSSPIVTGDKVYLTTVTTDGASKAPQIGTDFSNQYVAELIGMRRERLGKRAGHKTARAIGLGGAHDEAGR